MRIFLVDDDPLVIESFTIILNNHPPFHVVGHASNGQVALEWIRTNTADVVLMDIQMPHMNGIEACAAMLKVHPNLNVIMLTTFRDLRHVHQALHAGAKGYVLKTDDLNTQLTTIKHVASGHAVFSEAALNAFKEGLDVTGLTPRENECLTFIAQGLTNKEIASRMFLSEGSVRNLISVMLEKLDCRDRTQLAIYYWQTLA